MRLNPYEVRLHIEMNIKTNIPGSGQHGPDGGGGWAVGGGLEWGWGGGAGGQSGVWAVGCG